MRSRNLLLWATILALCTGARGALGQMTPSQDLKMTSTEMSHLTTTEEVTQPSEESGGSSSGVMSEASVGRETKTSTLGSAVIGPKAIPTTAIISSTTGSTHATTQSTFTADATTQSASTADVTAQSASTADTTTPSTSTSQSTVPTTTTSTTTCAPPAVEDLKVDATSSYNVSLSWTVPDSMCDEISSYTVSFSGYHLWGSNASVTPDQITFNETNNESGRIEVEIACLEPYSFYDFEVAPESGDSSNTSAITREAPPSEPENLQLNPSINEIIVTWETPADENGILNNYTVSWNIKEEKKSATTADQEYTIPDLQACVEYSVSVTASTGGGTGDPAESVTTTLPEVPPEVMNLNVTSASSRSISLSWQSPETECAITQYTLSYAGLVLWGDEEVISNSLKVSGNLTDSIEVTIDDLVPYTNYSIYVAAVTEAGPGSNATTAQQTDEDKPSEVRNMKTESKNSRSINVSWDVPEEENGVLLDYLILWYSDQKNGSNTSSSDTTTYLVTDLLPCVQYSIEVKAQTSVGYGNAVPSNSTTQTEVPPEVTDVRNKTVSSRSIGLTWRRPDTACEITRYVVTYEGEVLWANWSLSNQSAFPGNYNYTYEACLEELVPYTNYEITVAAENKAGNGTNSTPFNTTTLEDAPSPPSIKSVDTEHRTLKVSWEGPEVMNGALVQYSVTLYRGSSQISEHNVSAQTSHFTFEDLDYETTYNITVTAWTGGGFAGDSEAATTVPSPVPAIVGSIFGVLFLLVIVVVVYLKRQDIQKLVQKWQDPPSLRPRPGSTASTVAPPSPDAAGGVLWRKIANLQRDDGALLIQEFSNIQGNSYAGTTEVASANPKKNRFINILAYDGHRVMLGKRKDYINANYIKNYDQSDFLIAAQGPLPSTEGDWWQMILEQNATFVIMLTNCVENGKRKCHQYWPAVETWLEASADTYVYNSEEEARDGYIVRHLCITDPNGYSRLRVKQYHFTAWPDFGVPKDPSALLSFISDIKVDQSKAPLSANAHMVVHCSAGVGRTGTFICVWNLCHLYKANGQILDVPTEVLAMRQRRTNMVQTKDQLLFVYRCYAEFVSRPGNWDLPSSWEDSIAREFHEINQESSTHTAAIAGLPGNKLKNRCRNILPYDHSLVKLQQPPGYINASFVPDHSEKNKFIAAQSPASSTIQDWWQMILEQNVAVIVMLSNCFGSGQMNCAQYWPPRREAISLTCGWRVVTVGEENRGSFIIRTFQVKPETGGRASRTVVQYHFQAWPDINVPESPIQLLELMTAVKTAVATSPPQHGHSVIVHCSSGAGRTGTFIAVWNLCHKFRQDKQRRGVKQEILSLRYYRPQLVQTKDEYAYVRRCYVEFTESPDQWPLRDYDPGEVLYENINVQPHNTDPPTYENVPSPSTSPSTHSNNF